MDNKIKIKELGEGSSSSEEMEPILLSKACSGAPLFLIYECDLVLDAYSALVKELDLGVSVYGVRAITSADYSSEEAIAMEDLAASCIESMSRVCSGGSYRVLGISFCGLIAYEIAYQLVCQDEVVDFIALVNSENLLRSRDASDIAGLLNHYKSLCERYALDVDTNALVDYFSNINSHKTNKNAFLNAIRILDLSSRSYYPQPFPNTVHLFSVATNTNSLSLERGWQDSLSGHMVADTLEASETLFEPVVVEELSVKLLKSQRLLNSKERPARSSEFSPMITLQGGATSENIIFCVPGAGANITCFLGLADVLPVNSAVYGFQHRGFSKDSVPGTSIKKIAASYIQSIKKVQKSGPYCLLGHSFGGWIVLEIALQLSELGDSLLTPVLLDSTPPSDGLVAGSRYDRFEGIEHLIRIYEQTVDRSLGVCADTLKSLDEKSQIEHLHRSMVGVGLLPPRSSSNDVRSLLRVFLAQINARYEPHEKYQGKVLLINAISDDTDELRCCRNKEGWAKYIADLQTLDIQANHMSMLEKPGVKQIAQAIMGYYTL